MGLDITAYRQLTPAAGVPVDEDGYPIDYHRHYRPSPALGWSEGIWPGRCPELSEGTVYASTEQLSFRAGSYSGYGQWRSALAHLAGYADSNDYWRHAPVTAPFYELIHFADNEGVIGAAATAELAQDFAEHQAAADAIGGWFAELYAAWRRACEMAADSGAIDFH